MKIKVKRVNNMPVKLDIYQEYLLNWQKEFKEKGGQKLQKTHKATKDTRLKKKILKELKDLEIDLLKEFSEKYKEHLIVEYDYKEFNLDTFLSAYPGMSYIGKHNEEILIIIK